MIPQLSLVGGTEPFGDFFLCARFAFFFVSGEFCFSIELFFFGGKDYLSAQLEFPHSEPRENGLSPSRGSFPVLLIKNNWTPFDPPLNADLCFPPFPKSSSIYFKCPSPLFPPFSQVGERVVGLPPVSQFLSAGKMRLVLSEAVRERRSSKSSGKTYPPEAPFVPFLSDEISFPHQTDSVIFQKWFCLS